MAPRYSSSSWSGRAVRVSAFFAFCCILGRPGGAWADDTTIPDLSGWWAGEQHTTALVNLPILGELESSLHIFTLLRIDQEGRELRIRERVCRIDSEVPGPVELTYTPAFLRGISGDMKRARLIQDGSALRFREPERVRLLGVQLEDPAHDPLPLVRTDPRVRDPDRDGRPGLTVLVSGLATGQLYVIQRDVTQLDGTVVSPDRIEGVSRWSSEQVVLGATSVMLQSPPAARAHPDPARSPFVYRRLPEATSCGRLKEHDAQRQASRADSTP